MIWDTKIFVRLIIKQLKFINRKLCETLPAVPLLALWLLLVFCCHPADAVWVSTQGTSTKAFIFSLNLLLCKGRISNSKLNLFRTNLNKHLNQIIILKYTTITRRKWSTPCEFCVSCSPVIRLPLAFSCRPGTAFDRAQGHRLVGGGKPRCHLQRALL